MMKCKYYIGDSRQFIECIPERKKLCNKHCINKNNRLKSYKAVRKSIKYDFYKIEKHCFICGTTLEPSLEHIYTQSESKSQNKNFLSSCPSNLRRACVTCNNRRESSWKLFGTPKKKVHETLQKYDVQFDDSISFDFEKKGFNVTKENCQSLMYLTDKSVKDFYKLYIDDYKYRNRPCNFSNDLQYYKIIKNTLNIRKE